MSVNQPIVFLDVDGPLIPFGATRQQMPNGYPTFGRGFDNPLLERIDPALGPALQRLPADLVWATTWGEHANEVIAPILGLNSLEVLTWPEDESDLHRPRGVHWKTPSILDWAAVRPFVWIDDEVSKADDDWISAHHPGPSYLCRVDPRVGLTPDDLDAVARWIRGLDRTLDAHS